MDSRPKKTYYQQKWTRNSIAHDYVLSKISHLMASGSKNAPNFGMRLKTGRLVFD